MVPSVFISSTVEDLKHVREVIRSTVEELGYRPVMSEYGEIGFMDGGSAEDSCYKSILECQIMVVIIGKRYGCPSQKDSSRTITEFELETGQKYCGHLITLVDHEVLEFQKVHDENSSVVDLKYPGMNNPLKTFEFINRIGSSPEKNTIIPFSSTSDIRDIIKQQFAALFCNLLDTKSSPQAITLNSIASDLKTLLSAMSYQKTSDARFLAAMRFMFEEETNHFAGIVRRLFDGAMEKAIPKMIENDTFDQFLHDSGVTLSIMDVESFGQQDISKYPGMEYASTFLPWPPTQNAKPKRATYIYCKPATLWMNDVAKMYFDNTYISLKKSIKMAS